MTTETGDFRNDFLNPDLTDQSWRDEFTVNVQNLQLVDSIWITIANLSLRVSMQGNDILLETFPFQMENCYSGSDSMDALHYNIHELEDMRRRNAEKIELYCGDPFTPFSLSPRVHRGA